MNFTEDSHSIKLLHSTLDNLLEGCQILGFDWKYIYMNNSAEKHNQRSKNELLGKRYMDMWPGIENTDVFQRIRHCLENRVAQHMENEFVFPDGTKGWFELSIQPVPEGVFILSIDITEKNRIEKENLYKDAKFKHVFESANVGKSITQITGEIDANKAFCHMLGYEDGELNNKNWKVLTPSEDYNFIEGVLSSLLSGEKDSARFPKRYIKKNGSIIWCDLNVALYHDSSGNPLYFITTIIDITSQKMAEVHLRRSEHLFKLFVDHAPAAIAMFDKEMKYLVASDRYIKDYRIEDQKIIGRSHYEVFPEISDKWKEIHKKCLAGATERAEDDPFPRSNGSIDWVRWEIHPWYENDGEIGGIILFSELVTNRVLTDLALRKTEELFNRAFHGSPSPMAINRKKDGVFIAVNNSFLKLIEYSIDEVIGKNNSQLNLVSSELSSCIKQLLQEQGKVHNLEISLISKSGKTIFVITSIENFEMESESWVITTLQNITSRKIWELQLKEKNEEIEAQNEEYLQLNEELSQTNEELNEAKERAEESDRLKTAFLHNISHEIRTPMNSIIGFSSLLKNPELLPEKRYRFLQIVEQSSNQLLAIITDIINIASLEAGQVKVINNAININSLNKFLYDQFLPLADKKCLNLIYNNALPDNKSVILTDETKLMQILTNLLNNAMKFTEMGYINFGYTIRDGILEFFVEDTGMGIKPEMHTKIFNRFHQVDETRKSKYGGSGLGLSISKGYVELIGGKIWVVSKPGKGSVFYFTIPYLEAD